MAVSLGDINFGLGIDTRGMRTAIDDVRRFGQTVEQASRSTAQGAATAAAALRKQEAAAVAAMNAVLRMNQQMRAAGGGAAFMQQNSQAAREFVARMTAGRLSALEFQRATEAFSTAIARNTRSFKEWKGAADSASKSGASFSNTMKGITSSAVLAVGPLSGVGARIAALASLSNRGSLALTAVAVGLTAGATAAAKLASSAINLSKDITTIKARLDAITDSAGEANMTFEFLKETARRTGTDLVSTADMFTRMATAAQGTSLEGEKMRQVFLDMAFATAQFGLSAEETQGVMRAMEQMMSKGVVQAEELRGQIGDRLPGAFNIAAKAMGVTTMQLMDMMKKGLVPTAQFLPKFAAEYRKAVGADQTLLVTNMRAAIGRLDGAFKNFVMTFDETVGVSTTFTTVVDNVAKGIRFAAENMETLIRYAALAGAALVGLGLPTYVTLFGNLALSIGRAAAALAGFGAAASASGIGALAMLLTRIAGAAAAVYTANRLMGDGFMAMKKPMDVAIENTQSFIDSQKDVVTAVKGTTQQFILEVDKQIGALMAQQRAIMEMRRNMAPGNRSPANLTGAARLGYVFGGEEGAELFGQGTKGKADALFDVGEMARMEANMKTLQRQREELLKIQRQEVSVGDKLGAGSKARTDAQVERLNDANDQLETMRNKIEALAAGPNAFAQFERMDERTQAIERFRDSLEKSGISQSMVNAKVAEFIQVYDLLEAKMQSTAAMREMWKSFQTTVKTAFDSVADSMAEAIVNMELNAQTFVDITKRMVQEIISQILKLAIINPILNSIFPGFGGTAGLPAFFNMGGTTTAFGPGALYAQGGLITSPTVLAGKGGVGMAGEKGTEAILPLTKTAGGLGVYAKGGGGSPIINIITPPGTTAESSSRTGAGGVSVTDIVIKTVNEGMVSGKFDATMGARFGARTSRSKMSNY